MHKLPKEIQWYIFGYADNPHGFVVKDRKIDLSKFEDIDNERLEFLKMLYTEEWGQRDEMFGMDKKSLTFLVEIYDIDNGELLRSERVDDDVFIDYMFEKSGFCYSFDFTIKNYMSMVVW